MGGGSSFSKNQSTSHSRPTYTPMQKDVFKWMGGNVFPQAMGQETGMSKIYAQGARDQAATALMPQVSNAMNLGGLTGSSAGQIAKPVQDNQNNYLRNALANIISQRHALQNAAFQMIGNVPMGAGQKTSEAQSGFDFEIKGGMTS